MYLFHAYSISCLTIIAISFGVTQAELPRFTDPPEFINSTLTSIAIRLHNSTVGNDTAEFFQIQYKENNKSWKNITKPEILTLPIDINMEDFTTEMTYLFRAVLYTESNESYQEEDVPYVETRTVCQNVSQDIKLVKGFQVRRSPYTIEINWTPVCKATFQITVRCVDDAWCPEEIFASNYSSTRGTITLYHGIVMPYTNYTTELKVINSTEIASLKIKTLPSSPPEIRNFTIFSQDEQYLAVRWRSPYPPGGILEHYKITYVLCGENYENTYYIPVPEPCRLWDDYICHTITNLLKNHCYTVYIVAKNINEYSSASTHIKVNTAQAEPLSPSNLTAVWNEDDKLTLMWEHPSITRGQLVGFYINITLIDSEIVRRTAYAFASRYFNIDQEERRYVYTIEDILPLSATYNISVQGVNMHIGANIVITANAPPLKPALESKPVLGTRTATEQKIKIPPMDSSTMSHTGYVYVVVCDPATPLNEANNHENNEILRIVNCEGKSWITMELPANAFEIKTHIGDESIVYSKTLRQTLTNTALEASSAYRISVVLMNEYREKRRYNTYMLEASSYFNVAHYAWLVLLVLPVIGWFGYRYYKKRNEEVSEPIDDDTLPNMYGGQTKFQNNPETAEEKLLTKIELDFVLGK